MFDSKAATLTRPTTPADIAEIRTLPALFAWRVKRSPLGLAYREFDAIAEQWRDYSWHDTDEAVAHWKAALQQLALSKGDVAFAAQEMPAPLKGACIAAG